MQARIAIIVARTMRGAIRGIIGPLGILALALSLSGCPLDTAQKLMAPEITTQPVDVAVAEGDGVSFSVVAEGASTLSYRWYAGATLIGNCTTATCTIAPARAADAGDYHAEISNSLGKVASRNARLTVTAGPKVVTATSCNQPDIQDAVNRAKDGNVVQIPAGACSFADRTIVTVAGKSLWIRGAGKASTNIRRGGFIDTANTSENDIALTALFVFRCDATTRIRFSDMTLQGNGTEGTFTNSRGTFNHYIAYDFGIKLFACRDYRIHDSRFERFGYAGIDVNAQSLRGGPGGTQGLIDHDEFVANMHFGLGYGVAVSGLRDWPDPDYGSARNTFVEDSYFEDNRHGIAANYGARYVFRHNTTIATLRTRDWAMVDAHGRTNAHGTRSFEIYNNTFGMKGINGPYPSAEGAAFRGGDGVFFANTINLGNSPVSGKPYGIFLTIEDAGGCSSKAAYPVPDQTTDLYLWGNSNNNVSLGGDTWTDCANWFKEGRDFRIMPRPGYVAYAYPHPAQRQEWPAH